MKNLIYKEFRLAMHPTALIFLGLSFMLIIPNYPYYVTFFYTGLGVFFTCLGGRENNDVSYTLNLPVRKRDTVKARILYAAIIETIQVVVAVPFAALRQSMPIAGNQVGMDANIAFFGLSFIMMGIFNFVFFTMYYKNVDKVGKSFAVAATLDFVYMAIAETCTHIVPFFKDTLDTPDTENLFPKLAVLLTGIFIFALLNTAAYFKSAKSFEKIDL